MSKADSSSWENPTSELRDVTCHMGSQCYLPPDLSEHAPPNPSHAGGYSIYLSQRDGRQCWPSWLDTAPAGSRTSDLSKMRPMPNHYATKTNCQLALDIHTALYVLLICDNVNRQTSSSVCYRDWQRSTATRYSLVSSWDRLLRYRSLHLGVQSAFLECKIKIFGKQACGRSGVFSWWNLSVK